MTIQKIQFSFDDRKDDHVTIYHFEKVVTTLSGRNAIRFLNQVSGADTDKQQLAMAKATGNFKRGNERRPKPGNLK
jgi:hypothetical protein